MGQVWRAQEPLLDRVMALKVADGPAPTIGAVWPRVDLAQPRGEGCLLPQARQALQGRGERRWQAAVSASTLYRSVDIYVLCQELGVSTWKHLGVSQLRAVLGPPLDQQPRARDRRDGPRLQPSLQGIRPG